MKLALKVAKCVWVGSSNSWAMGALNNKRGKKTCLIRSVELEHFNQSWALKEPGVILLLAAIETSQAFHDITSFPCLNQWLILLVCLFLFLAARRNSKLNVSILLLMTRTSLPKVTLFTLPCHSWWVVFLPFCLSQGDFCLADCWWLPLKNLLLQRKCLCVLTSWSSNCRAEPFCNWALGKHTPREISAPESVQSEMHVLTWE